MSEGRRLDAALHLLDRQLIDRDGRLAGKVDDLELTFTQDGRLAVSALLTGPGALGPRLPHWLGRHVVAIWAGIRHTPPRAPHRIEYERVSSIETAIRLSADRRQLPTHPLEAWMERHVISKLPGAGHAPD